MKSFRVFKQALQPLIKARKNLKCSAMGGDCFRKAAKMIQNGNLPAAHTKLVHAIVKSSKEKRDMHHAWNEIGDVVIDRSNGQNVIMRKEQYYKLGHIKQTKGRYASYTADEMNKKLLKHQHWGPWDLDG